MLSTINWTGTGDGTTFNLATNWSPQQVPGSTDDAMISVSSGVTINLPSSGISVDSLTQTGGTLTMPGGTVTATNGLMLTNATFKMQGGSFGGSTTATVVNSTLNLSPSAGTAAFVAEGNSTLTGTLTANQSLQVEGTGGAEADLTLAQNASNLGTILLQSAAGNTYANNLVVATGTTFTNMGTINVNDSHENSNLTGGSFTNAGTFNINAGATLEVGTNGSTFTQQSGTLAATGNFICDAGTLLVTGGAVSGNVIADGSSLKMASSITAATTVYAEGNVTLVSNDSAMATVWVEGTGGAEADLTIAQNANNLGTILLQSAAGNVYANNLVIATGTTFNNVGTINVNNSHENSNLTGAFINTGTFNVNAGATLDVGMNGLTFTQQSGTLAAVGNFVCDAGTLLVTGGAVSGNVIADGSSLKMASSITAATTVYAEGNVTLVSNDSAMATVWVEGTGGAEADLTIAQNANNIGTILLQSAAGNVYANNLVIATGTTFTNVGTINVNNSHENSSLTGAFTNTGTFNVNSGATLVVGSSGLTFTQQSGTLAATGNFICDAGTLLVTGGAVSGNVIADGSSLKMASSITAATTVYAEGNVTLVSNDSAMATVWVEGTGGAEADLTIAQNANNIGTILLQSAAGNVYANNLVIATGTTFTNVGTINVNNSHENSSLTGAFTNTGTFNVNSGATLVVGSSGLTFTQQSGTLAATGNFICDAGTLLVTGGAVSGNVIADGSSLKMASSITAATTVYAEGNVTLVSNDSAMATVWVEGTGGAEADLTIAQNANNIGTILLQSAAGNVYANNLVIATGTTFNNVGTINVNISHENSNLTGTFTNQGTFNINGAALVLGSSTTFVNAASGQINASGTLNDASGSFINNGDLSLGTATVAGTLAITGSYTQTSTGLANFKIGGTTVGTNFDGLTVSGQAILAGTLTVVSPLLNGFAPMAGNAFKVLAYGSVSGSFATYTFPTLSGGLVFTPSQTATSLTLNVSTAHMLSISTPSNVMAGVPFTLNVAAKSSAGVTVTAYNGNVTIALSNGPNGAVLGGTLTATAVNGVASFTGLTLDVIGSGYTIQATAVSLVSATTNPFTVAPGIATQLVVSAPSSLPVVAGSPFTVTGTVEDAFGDVVTSDSGNVTIALSNGPNGSSLGGSATIAAVNGVATFSNLTLTQVSSSDTLSISRNGLTGATTAPFAVIAGAAFQLVISSQQPASGTAGVAFSAITVAVEDAYGNQEIANGSTVTATLASGAGALLGTTTVAASGGFATFSNLLDDSAGSITIQFGDSGLANATSTPIVISPSAATKLVIQTSPSPTAGVGQPFAIQPVIDEVDQYGNIETGDSTTTVGVALASGVGPLMGTTTVTLSGGVAKFTNLANGKIETISLVFSSGSLTGATSNNIVVGKATPAVTWSNPANITYGTALGSTQLDATASVPGTFVYSQPIGTILNAGQGQVLTATFTPTDTVDYLVVTSMVTINVLKATPAVTWSNPANITYGTALGSTQLDATASVPGTFVYSQPIGTILNAGQGQVLTATFTPTDTVDYLVVTSMVTINVLKATPVVTWATPTNITYGTALGSTQLDATASVAGKFVYTPAAGTILHAGQGQTLSETFTPTDTIDYTTVTTTVAINVLQAAPLVTWPYPASITYGTPLGSTQLDATASVAGKFVYTPAAGTILKVGAGQTLLVTFTPTDTVDYSIANSSATINVVAVVTSTALSIAETAATFKQPVTLSATVSGTAGAGTPTGSVSFLDGTTLLGSATLDGTGHASFSTASLPLGTRSITAKYSGDSGDSASTSSTTSLYVGDVPKVDFDGDGKVDFSVFGIDPNTGRYDYRIIDSTTGKTVVYDNNGYGYGNAQSIPIVGDFFGDGRASYALWTPNAFGGMTFTAVSPLNYKSISINFGSTTDLPVVADVNGDGIEDFGVFGFQAGLNYRFDFVLSSYNFSVNAQDIFNNNGYGYGNAQSIPIVADFDGSGKAGFGLYNPSANGSNFAYVNPATGASIARTIGTATDTPTAVDYDGDGKADLALYGPDPSVHGHYRYLILDSSSGFSVAQAVKFDNNGYGYGNSTSIPVMADYEGNGKADFGLFTADGKGGNEFVYLLGQTGTGVFVDFATATDIPLTAPTYLVAKKVRGY